MISWPMLKGQVGGGSFYQDDPGRRRVAIAFKTENPLRENNREDFRAKAKIHWALTKYEPRNDHDRSDGQISK